MLYTYVVRFDTINNLKNFVNFLERNKGWMWPCGGRAAHGTYLLLHVQLQGTAPLPLDPIATCSIDIDSSPRAPKVLRLTRRWRSRCFRHGPGSSTRHTCLPHISRVLVQYTNKWTATKLPLKKRKKERKKKDYKLAIDVRCFGLWSYGLNNFNKSQNLTHTYMYI